MPAGPSLTLLALVITLLQACSSSLFLALVPTESAITPQQTFQKKAEVARDLEVMCLLGCTVAAAIKEEILTFQYVPQLLTSGPATH